MSGLKPQTLNAFSKRQTKVFSDDQLAGLTKRQVKKADDFIDALSDKQTNALSFGANRSERLAIDPMNPEQDLVLNSLVWSKEA